jgi:ABC-type bacteriocin/lantibiotic exporter with double-glycine peptidase domain
VIVKTLLVSLACLGLGCGMLGLGQGLTPELLRHEPGWLAVRDVPWLPQETDSDCGAAALAMVLSHHGLATSVEDVTMAASAASSEGLAAGSLRDYARHRGAAAFLVRGELADLEAELALRRPVIVGLAIGRGARTAVTHYEVVVGLHPERGLVATLDPARGLRQSSLHDFYREWQPSRRLALVVIPPPRPG